MTAEDLPAMTALGSDEHRAFVENFCEHGVRERAYLEAYPNATRNGAKQSAHRLLQRRDIQAAVQEWSGRQLKNLVPDAMRALSEIVNDPFAKSRASVAEKILERAFPTVTKHEVHVTRSASDDRRVMLGITTRLLQSGAGVAQIQAVLGHNENLHEIIAEARETLHKFDLIPVKQLEFNPNEEF